MRLINKIKNAMNVNLFYLVVFSLTILSFSIGNSIVRNEKIAAQKYISGNVKTLSIAASYPLTISEIEEIASKYKITFWTSFPDNDTGYFISSEIIKNSFSPIQQMKSGRGFTNEEIVGEENVAITSTATQIDGDFEVMYINNKKYNFTTIGSYYGIVHEIFIPKQSFYDILEDEVVTNKTLFLWLGGEKEEIEKCTSEIKEFLLKFDENSQINSTTCNDFVSTTNGNFFNKASFSIIFIVLINSLNLSSLWIENRKKELAIRKAVGATDKEISRLFLKDLSIISCISTLIALALYLGLILITEGLLFNLNIMPTFISILSAIALTLGTAYIVSIFMLGQLNKLEASEVLRGE